MWAMAPSMPSTTFTAMMASRYSVSQSAAVAGFRSTSRDLRLGVAAHFAAGARGRWRITYSPGAKPTPSGYSRLATDSHSGGGGPSAIKELTDLLQQLPK